MEWDRFEGLLDELLDLSEAERTARLDELDRVDPDAASRLRRALDPGHPEPGLERIGSLIAAVADDFDPGDAAPPVPPPGAFGPWRPIERIASGGMGEVWLVERADGEYEATAALKKLHAALLTPATRERFVRERQLLADLHHPHIATLLDGGVDTNGAPFFVMEYVDGRSITAHCDEVRRTLPERLAVFEQVTDAVASAHRQLVVHRDLKPDNILVTESGEVKLVDFGIAKLLDEPADAGMTATHERILTPRYAAPEQIAGDPVTTASDVYALGIVLFELLSGCRPRSEADLRAALRSGAVAPDPPRMSVAFGQLDSETAAESAAHRGTVPRLLVRQLRGDLDEIVAKALRSKPEDRYPTVASLADDLRRARDREPVAAHRGSWLYRGRKFWARHWLPASAVLAVIAALSVGLSIALVKTRTAQLAESRSAAINRFLTDELLGSADPRVSRGRDLTVREVVDHAGRSVATAFEDEPPVEVSVRRTLGTVSARLGEIDSAREQLTAARALVERSGGDRLERARLARAFAELAFAEGRFATARSEVRSAVDGLTGGLGEDSSETLETRILAGKILVADGDVIEAERLLRELVRRLDAKATGPPVLAASARVELAAALKEQGRRDEALEELLEAARLQEAALGPDHPDLAQTLEQQAHIYAWIGRPVEAEAAARRALAIEHRVFGAAHWRSVRGASFLAEVLWRAGRTEEARNAATEALEAASPELDDDHPEIVSLRNMLANFATRSGDYATAEAEYRTALAGAERGLGPGAELTQVVRRNFANLLADHGDRKESLRLARRVREQGLEAAAAPQPDPMSLANVAWFLATAQLPEARDLDTALTLAEKAVEASGGRWYYPWVALSEVRSRRGELDQAIAAELRAVALPDGLHLPGEDRYLVRLLSERGDLAGAERFVREQLERRRAVRPAGDPLLAESRAMLGRVLLARGRTDEAERELRAALEQLDQRTTADDDRRLAPLSDLGAALLATGATGEAERLLRQAERLAKASTGERAEQELPEIEERLESARRATSGGSSPTDGATADRGGPRARPAP